MKSMMESGIDMDDKQVDIIIAGVFSLGIGLGILIQSMAQPNWQELAVEQGHAEWYIEDHEKEFRWLEPCNEDQK